MTMLTPNFSLEEMIRSATAAARGIDNTPPAAVRETLGKTARKLEDVRAEVLGNRQMIITSGFRCAALNAAVGGVPDSQHVAGEAVDFVCPDFGSPAEIVRAIAASNIPFDQCINEQKANRDGSFDRWVHISFSHGRPPRRQSFALG